MAIQLKHDIRGYHAGNISKRYLRETEAADEFELLSNEVIAYATAAGALYRLPRTNLIHRERMETFRKVDYLEDKQSKYIHEYVKNKEYCIVGTMRRHGFSQRDVDRQWGDIVDKIRRKKVDGVVIANMAAVSVNLLDAYVKVCEVVEAGGIIVTVDEGRLGLNIKEAF